MVNSFVLGSFLAILSSNVVNTLIIRSPFVVDTGLRISNQNKHLTCNRLTTSRDMTNKLKFEKVVETGVYNIPNILTFSRLFSIPVFILSFLAGSNTFPFTIYTLSCLTDLLDGYLARKWNQTSSFGAFLDPVADKLMVASALILLTSRLQTMAYTLPVTLIMLREISVSALREWMAEQGNRDKVKVGNVGKVKTAFQMIATASLLLTHHTIAAQNTSKSLAFNVGMYSLYISTILTMYSGFQYLFAAWPMLTATKSEIMHSPVNSTITLM